MFGTSQLETLNWLYTPRELFETHTPLPSQPLCPHTGRPVYLEPDVFTGASNTK